MFTSGKSMVGLDIGSTAIKAVELTKSAKGIEVTGFGQVEVDGADPESQAKAIGTLINEGGFNPKQVVTSVSGKMVIIRYLSMVPMSDDELRNAILFEAEKYIPFTLDECVLDCQRLDDGSSQGSGNANVLLVAVKDTVVNDHMKVLQKGGVVPGIVDVDAFALGNAFSLIQDCSGDLAETEEQTVAFVDIGATKTCVNIVQNGISFFTREVYFGGSDFTAAIARHFNVEEKEAESIKRNPTEQLEDIRNAVFPVIDDLGNELQLSFDYFETQFGRGVDKVMLSGGGARADYIREAFEKIFEKPTAFFNPFEGLEFSEDVDPEVLGGSAAQWVVAVGLASRIRKD